MKNFLLYIYILIYNIFIGIYRLVYSFIYYKSIKVYLCNHFTIGMHKVIKNRTVFPHPIGIVIGKNVVLGKKCTIYHNVTLGSKNGKYPIIGNNVTIFPNSTLIGDISIGDNVVIGANSLVLESVESNSVVVGNPLKKIK